MVYKKIEWDDSFLIGNELIDFQHKKLVELVGNIPERVTSQDEDVLAAAIQYAAKHFSDEEAAMEKINYPEFEIHKNMHKKMTRILKSHEQDYRNGKTDLYAFKQFMFQWIREHIMSEDQEIKQFQVSTNHCQPSKTTTEKSDQ